MPWQFHAQAAISSGDYEILAWLQERWGGHISKPDYRINPALQVGRGQTLFGSGVCTWSVSHRYVKVFLREILPYLKYKKHLAANALRFMSYSGAHGGHYNGLPPEVYAAQERCFTRHKELSAKLKAQRGRLPKKAA